MNTLSGFIERGPKKAVLLFMCIDYLNCCTFSVCNYKKIPIKQTYISENLNKISFGLVYLFNGIWSYVGYLMLNTYL